MSQKNDFWSKRAAKYDADIRNHDAAYTRRIRKTRSLLNKSDVVLDFGCASGEIGLDIAPHLLHVLGIDPAGGMIELANEKTQNREINNARFSPVDVFDPSLTGQSFSVILAFSVLSPPFSHDAAPPTLGARKVSEAASFRMSLSSVRSATG